MMTLGTPCKAAFHPHEPGVVIVIVSPAKLAANQANAQKSHGPVTEAGKNTCRENAVKHGLSGAGVALPAHMRAAVEEIVADWLRDFPPRSAYEGKLVRTMAVAMVRIEEGDARLLEFEAVRRQELTNSWDEIRADAAAALGEKLEKKPDRTVFQLRQTSHGCAWLQLRWECLREGLETTCDWSDAEVDQFFDLLGIPRAVRERDSRTQTLQHQIQQAKEGNMDALEGLRGQVDEQIVGLKVKADKLRQTTEALLQELIAGGHWFESSAEARSLRKLVQAAQREFDRTWDRIQDIRAGRLAGIALGGDEPAGTAPQVFKIAPKAAAAPSSGGAPAAPTERLGLTELQGLLGIPSPPEGATLHQRAAWEYDVVKQAVAIRLVDPKRLEAFRGLDAVLARPELDHQ